MHLPEAVVAMTLEEFAYAQALNEFGSDRESPEEHDILRSMRIHTHDGEAVKAVRSVNWQATLAAVAARGPRCDECGGWTFKPHLLTVPKGHRFCDYRCMYAAMAGVPKPEPEPERPVVIGRQAVGPFGAGYNLVDW